jgi:hypothetical protein
VIPVRVPATAKPVLASERRFAASRGHPLDSLPCPVCDGPLGDQVTVLVLAGIAPEDRKPAGATTGAAVAVHAACAGVPEEEPERPPRELPAWDEIEDRALCHLHAARNEMSEVRDWLNSDHRPPGSPLTAAQAGARREVLRITGEVKRLIDQAKDELHG